MPLLDAPAYDARRERNRRNWVIAVLVLVAVIAFLFWKFRNYREEHEVNQFLTSVEHKDWETAYAIWNHDPDWKQHPDKYKNYTYGQFQLDWGPSGDNGEIRKHDIVGSAPSDNRQALVVCVRINDRAELTPVIVDKRTKEIGFSPVGCRVNTF